MNLSVDKDLLIFKSTLFSELSLMLLIFKYIKDFGGLFSMNDQFLSYEDNLPEPRQIFPTRPLDNPSDSEVQNLQSE